MRGAYHSLEIASHRQRGEPGGKSLSISSEAEPPVHLSKDETDACYNECARLLISRIRDDVEASEISNAPPTLGLLSGSHNWESCNLVINELVRNGLAEVKDDVVHISEVVAERVTIAQLYGMRDALTNSLVERTRCKVPLVMKYVSDFSRQATFMAERFVGTFRMVVFLRYAFDPQINHVLRCLCR